MFFLNIFALFLIGSYTSVTLKANPNPTDSHTIRQQANKEYKKELENLKKLVKSSGEYGILLYNFLLNDDSLLQEKEIKFANFTFKGYTLNDTFIGKRIDPEDPVIHGQAITTFAVVANNGDSNNGAACSIYPWPGVTLGECYALAETFEIIKKIHEKQQHKETL